MLVPYEHPAPGRDRTGPSHPNPIIDTSASVSDVELRSALLEVAAISRAVGGRRGLVTVLACDAATRVVRPQRAGATSLRGRRRALHPPRVLSACSNRAPSQGLHAGGAS